MATKYKSISAAKKAGSIYYYDKKGTKQLAVTKETLDAWKKKNKGSYKGSSLTAWANAKGKDLKKKATSPVRKGDGTGAGVTGVTPVRKGDGTGAGTKKAKKALNNSAEAPPQTLKRLEKEMKALEASRNARRDKIKEMKAETKKLLKETKPKDSTTKAEVEKAMGGNYDSVRDRRSGKFNKKGVGFMEGGMAKKKPSMYNKGGMKSSYSPGGSVAKPMVMKGGKKVPAYAADGVGKMNMGGMAKKKYSYGGSVNSMKKGRG